MIDSRSSFGAPERAAVGADVWVVVPAFNEGRTIARVVRDLQANCPLVVVVDDGSADGTGRAALREGAVVVRHFVNLGQGAALQTGIDYALSRGAAVVATFDADGQHDVDDLLVMLRRLQGGDVDVVLGSRFLGRADGIPVGRRMALRLAVLFTRAATGMKVTDVHNGLRVMTGAAARRLHLTQEGMAHASEVLTQIHRARLRFAEVPVTITYTPYSLAKGQKLADGFRILTDLVAGWLLR
jgi:polyprenyl-phospho-N-acetylgalactosaminyl synthase